MASSVATPTDFWRLAEEAEQRGIKILVEPISGEHFATSGSKGNILYRLTGFSCTCKGFLHWQRGRWMNGTSLRGPGRAGSFVKFPAKMRKNLPSWPGSWPWRVRSRPGLDWPYASPS